MRLLLVLLGSIVLGLIGAAGLLWLMARGVSNWLFGPVSPDAEGQSTLDNVFAEVGS